MFANIGSLADLAMFARERNTIRMDTIFSPITQASLKKPVVSTLPNRRCVAPHSKALQSVYLTGDTVCWA